MQPRRGYRISEACQLTSLGRTKLYEAIGLGLLDARKWGRRTIIPHDAIERFLRNLPPMVR